MTVAPEKDFTAIGVLASHLRCPVQSIERAASSLGLEPSLRLSGIVYFTAAQCERIAEKLRGQK